MSAQKPLIEKTIKPAVDFIKKINSSESVTIVYGHDNDTICSAVVVYKLLKSRNVNADFFTTEDNFSVSSKDVEGLKKIKPENVIVVDIAHLSPEAEKYFSSIKSLIIDHHQPLKLEGIAYSNPREYEKKIYMPVSYIVYKIFQKFGDTKDIAWIAGLGVLSDHGVSIAHDLFKEIRKINPRLIMDVKLKDEDLFSYSRMGIIAKILDSVRIVSGREGSALAVKVLMESNDPREIMKSGSEDAAKLIEWSDIVKKEFKRLVSDFNKKRILIKGKIIFYEIESKLKMKSSLSGYLAQFYKKNVLIIIQESGSNFDISFRRGEDCKVDLNKLAKKSTKDIPDGGGGGHEAASGGRIPVKYLSKFLKQL